MFEPIIARLRELAIEEKHDVYRFSEKQNKILIELDDLFLADIFDRLRDFEKSVI